MFVGQSHQLTNLTLLIIIKYTCIHIYLVMYTYLSNHVCIIRYTYNTYVHFQMLQISLQHCCWASYPISKQFAIVNLVPRWRPEFSYLKSKWSYHTNIMDCKNSRKRFRFPTSDELLNQNDDKNDCTIVMAFSKFDLLFDLGTLSTTPRVCDT